MSDENDSTTIDEANGGEPIPESDPVIDCAVLLSQREQLKQQVRDMERQLQQKQYELDINGGLARLNVAAQILGGLYANSGALDMEYDDYGNHRAINVLDDLTAIEIAERVSEDLVSRFENRMEKRAAEFMKTVAMSPSDEINPAGREN